MAICKFLVVMRNRRAIKWTDIKELSPLKFMPYVAELFKNVTGKDLKGLSEFTGWIGLGGYYHWKLETGTVGPAPGLPTPPRASGTQWTRGPTKQTTSPTEVNPNWDPSNWSLRKASGWKRTNLWSGWKNIHLKSGWKNIHLEPGRKNIHLESGRKNIHLKPGQKDIHLQPGWETGLHRQRWEASHLRGPG